MVRERLKPMQPRINQQLFIQLLSGDRNEMDQEYKSRIADLRENLIYMEVPLNIRTGRLRKLNTGDLLSIYYVDQDGIKYKFTSEVVGFGRNVIPQVIIQQPDPSRIAREQRRRFLRVPAELEISVKIPEQGWLLGLTENISGGGLSAIFDGVVPLEANMRLTSWLHVPFKNGMIEFVQFVGEVLRVNKLETGRQLVMFKFVEIAPSDEQKIIRFCFERQLLNKK
ncbi:MAG TPA: flagellar brake domain-containing protein [Bacilli bacterium]